MSDALAAFVSWFIENGGYLHPLLRASSSSTGNFPSVLPGNQGLAAGDRIVSCPMPLTISFSHACKSALLAPVTKPARTSSTKQTVCLRLFLMEQYLLGDKSFWFPYISSLPKPDQKNLLNTAMWFDEDELHLLHGTNLGAAVKSRRQVWSQELEHALRTLTSNDSGFVRSLWTWELYLWAATMITSRSFPDRATGVDDTSTPMLVPGLDLLNHDPTAKVIWDFNDGSYTIKTASDIKPAAEIFNNYGPKSNEELLMGYGFCIPDNPADCFGLGFNAATSRQIKEIKSSRQDGDVFTAHEDDSLRDEFTLQAISEQHSVQFKKTNEEEEMATLKPVYSPNYIEHFSIILENKRERHHHRSNWAQGQRTFNGDKMCRNKLHTIAATKMLLEKSLAGIDPIEPAKEEEVLGNPRIDAALIYHVGQGNVLRRAIADLRHLLKSICEAGPASGLVRLEDILNGLPKAMAKDYRHLIHLAAGTRDPDKIRSWGAEETAFTFWLCGIWILHSNSQFEALDAKDGDQAAVSKRLSEWVYALRQKYGNPPSSAQTMQDIPYDYYKEPGKDDVALAESYLGAILAQNEKRPQSLYISSLVDLPFMLWCLGIVKEEVVRCPLERQSSNDSEEHDEAVLFLDTDIE